MPEPIPARAPARQVLIVVIIIGTAALAMLRSQISLFDTPFLFPDSFDWLVNGLQYARSAQGVSEISHRGMFLTLFLSVLYRLNQIDAAVLAGSLFHGLLCLVVLFSLERFSSRSRAVLVSAGLFCSFTLLGQSAYVGADVIANFFVSFFSVLFIRFLLFPKRGLMYGMAVVAGIGVHTQYIFPILAPLYGVAFLAAMAIRDLRVRIIAVLASKHFFGACIIFFLTCAAFFAPRVALYHLIYEERVQHASLISFDLMGGKYFSAAFLVSFSWWIAGLAFLGAVSAVSKRTTDRALKLFSLLWIADIFVFFGFFYSWKDTRFWLYAAVPVFLLAAAGLEALFRLIGNRFACIMLGLFTLFMVHSTPTNDPWDRVLMLSPTQAFAFDAGWGGGTLRSITAPYLYRHIIEIGETVQQVNTGGFSHVMRDTQARIALRVAAERAQDAPIGFFEAFSPSDFYIAVNRNKAYAESMRVQTFGDSRGLEGFLAAGHLIVARESQRNLLEEMLPDSAKIVEVTPVGSTGGPFYIFRVETGVDLGAPALIGRSEFEKIEGGEQLDSLFDGVSGIPENFATIAFETPLRIRFRQAISMRSVELQLWNFDPREYEVEVTIVDDVGNRRILPEFSGFKRGDVRVKLGGSKIREIEIRGKQNTSSAWIPNNNFLHLREIRLKRMREQN